VPSQQDYADEMRSRAIEEDENVVAPGEPTLVGWMRVLLADVASLRAKVAELEADRPG
jgi:hypothetical protein